MGFLCPFSELFVGMGNCSLSDERDIFFVFLGLWEEREQIELST